MESNNSPVHKGEKERIADKFNRLTEAWTESCMKAVPCLLKITHDWTRLSGLLEVLEPILPDLREEIEGLHVQGHRYMKEELGVNIKLILENHEFARKHDKLQQLIEEARQREPVECQLLPSPAQVTEGTLNKAKLLELERLQNTLDDLTAKNYDLLNQIRQEKKKKQEKEKKLLKRVALYYELNKIANSIPSEEYFQLQKNLK
ncbi:hypothetical protein BD560DRAFT_421619 [Blakeslea trispora]|nr:hypothetical protein BD560DRAFT_421619 [Blakeslea trispora]